LIGALRSPVIWQFQGQVGIEHSHQGHTRKIVTLGYHLGPEQDVDLPLSKAVEDPVKLPLAAGGVEIQPLNPGLGITTPELLLHPLNPGTQKTQRSGSPTPGTARWKRTLAITVMAVQVSAGPVVHQGDGAMLTLQYQPA
jgi:hypothetical protein